MFCKISACKVTRFTFGITLARTCRVSRSRIPITIALPEIPPMGARAALAARLPLCMFFGESLIHFDWCALRTTELHEGLVLHCNANPMEHEPCTLLGHADILAQLVTRNSILAVDEQPSRREPLIEADGRILEHGPNFERELLLGMVAIAAIDVCLCQPSQLSCAAIRAAGSSIGPAHENHEATAVLGICKVLNGLN